MPNMEKNVVVRVSLEDDKKYFQKIGGSRLIGVTTGGDIEVPSGTTAMITFLSMPGDNFSKDGQGNYISFMPTGPKVLSASKSKIVVRSINPNEHHDVKFEYALYLNGSEIDPAIINKGTGGIIPKPKKKPAKKVAKPAAKKPAAKKPATRGAAKPAAKKAVKPAAKKVAKPAAKKAAKKSAKR